MTWRALGWRTCVLMLATLVTWPQAGRAEILFFAGAPSGYQSTLNTLGLTDGNVLYNDTALISAGPLVQGITLGSQIIDFQAPVSLTSPAQGQARVEGLAGGFTSISIAPDSPGELFRALSLAVNPAEGTTGSITLDLLGSDGLVYETSVSIRPGLVFFGAIATGPDSFLSASLGSEAPLTDIRQVRVDLADWIRPEGGGPIVPLAPSVPEPRALLLFGLGVLVAMARRLRRWATLRAI